MFVLLHFGFHPMHQSLPVIAAEQDERELRDALSLDEGDDFEKIRRACRSRRACR